MSDKKKEEKSDDLEIGLGGLAGLAAAGAAAYFLWKSFSSEEKPAASSAPASNSNSDNSLWYDNNRANQLNPNHTATGPGRPAGYPGSGTQADLDNRSRQLNPQDPKYGGGKK